MGVFDIGVSYKWPRCSESVSLFPEGRKTGIGPGEAKLVIALNGAHGFKDARRNTEDPPDIIHGTSSPLTEVKYTRPNAPSIRACMGGDINFYSELKEEMFKSLYAVWLREMLDPDAAYRDADANGIFGRINATDVITVKGEKWWNDFQSSYMGVLFKKINTVTLASEDGYIFHDISLWKKKLIWVVSVTGDGRFNVSFDSSSAPRKNRCG